MRQATETTILQFGSYRLDLGQRLLYHDNEEIPLPPKVFDTLQVLVEQHGQLLDKNYLMKTLWPDSFVEECSLARNISLLRKTLRECSEDQEFIQTIPKRGYRFVAAVQALSAEESVPTQHEIQDLHPLPNREALMKHAGSCIGTNGPVVAPDTNRIEMQVVAPAIRDASFENHLSKIVLRRELV